MILPELPGGVLSASSMMLQSVGIQGAKLHFWIWGRLEDMVAYLGETTVAMFDPGDEITLDKQDERLLWVDPDLAVIHLCLDWINIDVVAHEVQHFITFLIYALELDATPGSKDNEDLSVLAGMINMEFWRLAQRSGLPIDPLSELAQIPQSFLEAA